MGQNSKRLRPLGHIMSMVQSMMNIIIARINILLNLNMYAINYN